MSVKKFLTIPLSAALACTVVACSSDSGSSSASGGEGGGDNYILVNGTEPQNPLVPADTNETGGGKIIDQIFSGLVYYDSDGKEHNDLAEKIETEDSQLYTITVRKDAKFSDGSPVKAENFVKAWNYAVANDLMSASFMEPIKGYAEGAKEMEGLKIVDDQTFTVELTQPEADFPLRLGYSAFFPLPDVAYDDIKAYGDNPVSNGPYKLAEWNHDTDALIVPNPEYNGPREVKNDGVKFVFYPQQDAAYADLLSGQLDVLDSVPDNALTAFETDLDGRSVNQPAAVFQSFTIPERLEHFSGEEGNLRRQAISMAINRDEVTDKIFQKSRTPAKDFTSPVIAGYSDDIKGSEVLKYDPEKAKELWAKADEISPWSGKFEIAYNADGGHQGWVDAVTNSIRNTLGIDAEGKPYPDFKSFRDDISKHTITTAFRTGWQADYPGLGNFLVPLYTTGASSNDGEYSSPEFDAAMKKAAGATSVDESNKLYNDGQEILFKDLPATPLWYSNATGGWADTVDNVKFNWKSVPDYNEITKK
ncbi:peptide ABC transporter substrate-binding protein [Corynebacterium aquilae]|uniref:ABC transporter substrate-binding protein n=1 Tax=Corynebacterium aquilae DSM 44791 TaxID=1431546 RepID=A0A1L7CF13_9CORY|nr:ABC transporter substrate-binding protein [Corynebacterium aquilae]APT84470.1 ABC transporter substrate-binding protein [Corynebacterium aquilae DSM 44791]